MSMSSDVEILTLLREQGKLLKAIHDQTHLTNGRVTKLETMVAVLKWAVFLVGPAALGALGYLYVNHMSFRP